MTSSDLRPARRKSSPRRPPLTPRSWRLLGGAAVVLTGLSLRWYESSLAGRDVPGGRNGWSALDVLAPYLALVVVGAVALAVTGETVATARTALAAATVVGLAAVSYRVVSPPGGGLPGFVTEESVRWGPFVTGFGLVLVLGACLFAPAGDSDSS